MGGTVPVPVLVATGAYVRRRPAGFSIYFHMRMAKEMSDGTVGSYA
jgi:hypothetical protein